MTRKESALVVAQPPVHLARSLAEARARSFVYVDNRGQVRSPARYRALQTVGNALLTGSILGAPLLYGMWFGPIGWATGVAFSGYVWWQVARARRVQQAVVLIAHDRLDEAELVLQRVRTSPMCPRNLRAAAEQNLAVVCSRRGNFDEALAHQRVAMSLYARGGRRNQMRRQMVEYAEIQTLVNLGRVEEARQRFLQKQGRVPDGDYLRLLHWTAELYLCFAIGSHSLDADALHERARTALHISGASVLLALSAWAHLHAGDTDQAWHLLREAFDRQEVPIDRAMPPLHAWMMAHAAEAGLPQA